MEFANSGQKDWYLTTSWGIGRPGQVRAKPVALLLPLYNKIRIPYHPPLSDTLLFAQGLDALGSIVPVVKGLDWDFRLTTLNQFRGEVATDSRFASALREELLTLSLPRFLWRASATQNGVPVVHILFDATDIATGAYVRKVVVHESGLAEVIDRVMNTQNSISEKLSAVFGKRNNTAS